MKDRFRTVAISAVRLLGGGHYSRSVARKSGPLLRVLCFHHVPDQAWFESYIRSLVTHYHLVTPNQVRQNDLRPDKINILCTFDDGYQSWLDICVPVLAKHNITGVFFINSGLIDSATDPLEQERYVRDRLRLIPKKTLTWEGVQQLINAGHEIGGHSVGHFDLTTLNDEELEWEILSDKDRITEKTGSAPRWFAYPFGTKKHYSDHIMQVVSNHYEQAFTAETGFATKLDYEIPRQCVVSAHGAKYVKPWIEGSYDIFARIVDIFRR